MPPRADVYLWDVRNAGKEIIDLTAGKTLSQYKRTRILQLAVERCFITIGEATVRLRREFPDVYQRISVAPKVIAFRNHVAHRYDVISNEETWKIVEVFLSPFLQQVEEILKEGSGE